MDRSRNSSIPGSNQYIYTAATVIVSSALCFALSEVIGYRVVALLLLMIVSILAMSFDILPVLLAAALSAFIWGFFFIPPRFTIHVEATEDVILLIMYFIIAMINGVLTYKIKQVEKVALIKEEKANSVKLYNTIMDSLSHELRTPIAAIIGATDNLQWNNHLTENDKEQLIAEISKASLRLNQQVENLLNISRLESGHIKPNDDWCDVVELIYDVAKRVEENSNDRKINISISQHLPLCKIDKGILDQVLYNLLNNAAIHTEPGTKIGITASCHADLLEIMIEDSGKGFGTLDKKEIFQKFSRERRKETSGSGLGLSIVKGFTEALGGKVELTKSAAGGAQFTLIFHVKTTSLKAGNE